MTDSHGLNSGLVPTTQTKCLAHVTTPPGISASLIGKKIKP